MTSAKSLDLVQRIPLPKQTALVLTQSEKFFNAVVWSSVHSMRWLDFNHTDFGKNVVCY